MQSDTSGIQFQVLGQLAVVHDGDVLAIGGPKPQTVLAMLLAGGGDLVSADAIEYAVYGDAPPARSRRILQTYISTLRSFLGKAIEREGNGWRIDVSAGNLDAMRFTEAYHATAGLRPSETSPLLKSALALWRGRPYENVRAHNQLDAEITRLTELGHAVSHALFNAELALGHHREVIADIEVVLAERPLDEAICAQHMLALYRSGRHPEALRSFRRLQTALAEELGLSPGAELRRLEQQILRHDPNLLTSGSESADGIEARARSPLPEAPNPIVGRDRTINDVQAMLVSSRLVTLVGVGGCGKTRLALEIASLEQRGSGREAYFVDLSVVSSPIGVLPAIGAAVGTGQDGDVRMGHLTSYLADRKALIVLDNCEHLIDTCADWAARALAVGGDWCILATSREHLGIAGEQVFPVPALDTHRDGAAAQLFESRSLARNPDLVFTAKIRSEIADLCRRLDGLPLAIELAAARMTVMTPGQVVERLNDGISVLTSGSRAAPDRSRTLEATLDWSFNLLDDDDRRTLAACAVFRGWFDADAAAAVVDRDPTSIVDVLESLVAKSMMATNLTDRWVFRLLEPVRLYAESKLAESGLLDDARTRHLEHHRDAATGADRGRWTHLRPNIEAAIDFAFDTDRFDDAVDLFASSMGAWHDQQFLRPSLDRLDRLLAVVGDDQSKRERLIIPEILIAWGLRDRTRLMEASARGLQAEDEATRFHGYAFLANELAIEDPDESLRLIDAASAEFDHPDAEGPLAKLRADLHMFAGRYDEALALIEPHVDRFVGNVSGAVGLHILAGRPISALRLLDAHVGIWLGANKELLRGLALLQLDRAEAAEILVGYARFVHEEGGATEEADALLGLASLLNDRGDNESAARLLAGTGTCRWYITQALADQLAQRIAPSAPMATGISSDEAVGLLDATLRSQDWLGLVAEVSGS